jgi:hypothetical protein
MISDTTVEEPFVWNDTTTFYDVVITDSIGCSISDGVFQVNTLTASLDKIFQPNINVYPNPTSQNLNVDSDQEIKSLKVYSLNGQIMKEQKGDEIDFSLFKNGLYLLRIEFGDMNFATRLIEKISE